VTSPAGTQPLRRPDRIVGLELGLQRGLVLLLGLLSCLVLGLGLYAFTVFEPPGEHTNVRARVLGVFPVDPATGRVGSHPSREFAPDQPFAAVVDWGSLPPDLVVAARWFDGEGSLVGGVGPAPAGQLSSHPVVGTILEAHDRPNPPGTYEFVVEQYSGGRPVAVLARLFVQVTSSS
jgi:hypothetical protein